MAGTSISLSTTGALADIVNATNLALGGSQTAANGNELGILIGSGATAVINGAGDGANSGTNVHLTVNGSNFSGNFGAGDGATINGGGARVDAGANVGLMFTGGGVDTVTATGDALGGTAAGGIADGIALAANMTLNLYGATDGLSLQSGDLANLHGSGDTAQGSGATIDLAANSLSASIIGNSDTASSFGGVTGANVTFLGAGEMDLAPSAIIYLGSAATGVTANATGVTALDTNGIIGGTVTFDKTGGLATLTNGTVDIGANGITTAVNGQNNLVNGGGSSGEIIQLGGANQTVDANHAYQVNFTQGSTGGVLNGSYDGTPFGTGVMLKINGVNDTAYWNGDTGNGSGTDAILTGTNFIDQLANGALTYASGASSATLMGSNMTVNALTGVVGESLAIGASAASLSINAGNMSIADANGVIGGNLNINAGGDTATVQGATVNVGGAFLTTIIGSGDVCNASTAAGSGDIVMGANSGSDIVNWLIGPNDYASSTDVSFNPNSSTQFQLTDWSGGNLSGSEQDNLNDWTAGGSQLTWYNLESGVSEVTGNFTGANESGELTTETLATSSGYNKDFNFQYSGSGQLTGYTENYYDGGAYEGSATFNASGYVTGYHGTYGQYTRYDGGYGYGADAVDRPNSSAPNPSGRNIGGIAVFDRALRHAGTTSAPPPTTVAQAAHAEHDPATAPLAPTPAPPATASGTVEPPVNPHLFAPGGFVQAAAALAPSAAAHSQVAGMLSESVTLIARPHCAYA